MKQLEVVYKPLVPGAEAILTASTHKHVANLTMEIRKPGGKMHSPPDAVAVSNTGPPENGQVNFELTLLQQMIQEILDPLDLQTRSVKKWRTLYRSFFAFFAPDGNANATERQAWGIATDVFNTNLVAVSNRTSRVVPMTFQDFVDGIDSFRHEGLREGSQRDVAWQPKKILLLMATMIGRVVAGWQADTVLVHDPPPGLYPFRNYLISANRKADFLRSVFDFNPRFSILEFGAAGLKSVLHAFPHFALALMENGMFQCEFCPSQVPLNPPLLRAHFLKPLRAPTPIGTLPSLYLVLLNKAPLSNAEGRDLSTESSYFEFSTSALDALAFEPSDAPETKSAKLERLFELTVSRGLLLCSAHRADASTAARIGKTLGRTQAERFAIERFFALGFRNGHGNEPWLERAVSAPPTNDPEKVKKVRKQFRRWKATSLFFLEVGEPEAAEISGASLRQEALQAKGSVTFLSLLNTPVYAPLMSVFLAADAQGKWLIDEPELHAFARNLNGDAGNVLAEASQLINRHSDTLRDNEMKGLFLFECAAGILLTATGAHKSPKRLACLERAKDALRQHYERSLCVALSRAPSALRAELTAPFPIAKQTLEKATKTIEAFLAEPLSRKVSGNLRMILEHLTKPGINLAQGPEPPLRLENRTAFEESLASLYAWVKSTMQQEPDAVLSSTSQFLTSCVELREIAEEGRLEEALAKSSALYPNLQQAKKDALAPFFGELAWLLLQRIEQQLHHGNHEKAMALAEMGKVIIEATPLRDEFKSLFARRPAAESTVPPVPSTGALNRKSRDPMADQAEVLLRDHADELGMAENQLEKDFLLALIEGSVGAFKRTEKLRSRLQRRTQWGGREPYRTILRLLQASTERET